MGKLNKDSDSDDRMDIEAPQPIAKHKKIKKKLEKPAPQNDNQNGQAPKKQKSLASKAIRSLSKMVNLPKQEVQLTEKQEIFKKIVDETKGGKKVNRKERKKQRVQIKKSLRKEFQIKLPVPAAVEANQAEGMQEEKPVVRKEKFQEQKVVEEFKKNIGLNFGSLKKLLAKKTSS